MRKSQESNVVKLLISKTGNISIEKNSDNKFKINSEKITNASSLEFFDTEGEAKIEATKIAYKQIMSKLEKSIRAENIILLTGAGASKECGGPSMVDLWKATSKDSDIKSKWDAILKMTGYDPATGEGNLEVLLSRMQAITHAYEINQEKGENYSEMIEKIEGKILSECRNVKVDESSSHVRCLTRVLKARSASSPRLKVFTLNYDTAFEQAGDKIGAVVIDGFLLSPSRTYESTEFDLDIVRRERSRIHQEDNFHDKVFQLYKMHGSVDWRADEKSGVISKDALTKEPVLIYPNSSKFERSFQMPFFEMISRLQSVLRKENTTLFIVGYSFGDGHVNRIISESIRNNLNLEIFIVKPNLSDKKLADYVQDVEKGSGNIHLISSTFEQFSSGLPDVKNGGLFSEETNDDYEKKSIRSQ